MKEKILILLTGGTMDGIANPGDEKNISDQSAVKTYFDSLDLYCDFEFKNICTKDSRELNDDDRNDILDTIKDSNFEKILIIHGTFTMDKTGQFLKKSITSKFNKTVVLTGSMIPLQKWYPGDAPFNLGYAISTLLYENPGIYIVMNGQTFDPDTVHKNVEKLRFEIID